MTHKQKDIIMKTLVGTFSDDALRVIGLYGIQLEEPLPAELNSVENREIDMAWRMHSGDVFHLEFQTKREPTLHRFLEYDVKLARQYQTKVRTVVLYHDGVANAPEELDIGTAQYRVENVYLCSFDGDAAIDSVAHNLDDGTWSATDRIRLSLALNMKLTRRTVSAAMDDVIGLIRRIPDPVERGYVCIALIGLTNRVLSESERLRMKKELIGLYDMAQEIYEDGVREGLEKGLEKGRQEGLQKGLQKGLQEGRFDTARNMLREGVDVEDIMKWTKLSRVEVEKIKIELN